MKEKIKKFLENGRSVFIALFILEMFLTIFVTPNRYDDKVFLESVTGTSIASYVLPRYFNWTSRTIIEFVLCGVLKTSKYLWILIEALMVTLVGYSISKIFVKDNKKENNVMLLFMILAGLFLLGYGISELLMGDLRGFIWLAIMIGCYVLPSTAHSFKSRFLQAYRYIKSIFKK